jgi:hypothetical protein
MALTIRVDVPETTQSLTPDRQNLLQWSAGFITVGK